MKELFNALFQLIFCLIQTINLLSIMGIKGLTSFVSKEDLRNRHKLSDGFVVIDGNNLMFYIYSSTNSKRNDDLFGGIYDEYGNQFRKFVKNLKKCNISPILVFDGGLNLQLKDNRMKRFEVAFDNSKDISDNPPQNDELRDDDKKISPSLLKDTMMSVMKEFMPSEETKQIKSVAEHKWRVFCFQTVLDSDLDSAKLANDLKCPLISNDGDFLLMNIDEGVISCDSLKWETPLKSNNSKYYIECKIYKIIDFTNKFDIKPEMLPIFASLMGNDGIKYEIFDKIFIDIHNELHNMHWLSEELRGSYYYNSNNRWLRMKQLLYWLSHRFFSASQAIHFIERYLIDTKVDLKDFKDSINSYQTNGNTFLKQLFDHKIKESDEKDIPIEEIVNEYRFPKWFLLDYIYRTEYDSTFFSLIDSKFLIRRCHIENFDFNSCGESSIELYAFLLGLLRLNTNDKTPVRVITRKGHAINERDLYPKTHINCKELPILSQLRSFSLEERKTLLFDFLKFKDKWMTDLEEELLLLKFDKQDIDFWKYFLVVIKYWKHNTRVKHHFEFIRAIVYSLIYFRHNSLIRNDFNGLTSETKDRFKPFVSHYFCEFQSIYSTINKTIALLGFPITAAKLHHYLNGVLYYNLMNEIIDGRMNLWPFKEHRLNSITNFIIKFCSVCID